MEVFTASDFKNSFGKALMKSQQGPVCIEKHGEAVGYLVSATAFEEYETYKHAVLKAKIEEGLADLKAGNVIDGKTVMNEMRQLIADA
jgi:prevent-host-death family protein